MKSDNTLLCPDVRRTYDTDWFLLSVRLNIKEFCVATQLKECVFMGDVNPLGTVIFQWFQKGLQKHLEDLLADTKDDNTSTGCLDCVVFGHLSQFLYIKMDFPQKSYLKEYCQKLVRFMDNFQQKYFNDWDILCERQPNHAL